MMAPLGATTFETTDDRLTATWASLPDYDGLDLWRESFSSDFSRFVIHDLWISSLSLAIPAPVTDPGGDLQRAATGRAAAPADSGRAQDRARFWMAPRPRL